jgi:LysM repeat protein
LVNRQVEDELRRLNLTNTVLHQQVDQLKTQLIEQATAFSNRLAQATQAAAQSSLAAPSSWSEPERDRRSSITTERPGTSPNNHTAAPRPAPNPKTHVVKPGETLAAIAKKYNLKLSSLQAANPSVEARKLRAGQVLNLPVARN